MTPAFPDDVLARWGVDRTALGELEEIALPDSGVHEARAFSIPLRRAQADHEDWRDRRETLAVRSDVLHAIGLSARFDPVQRRLELAAPVDLGFTISPAVPGASVNLADAVSLPVAASFQTGIESTDGGLLALCHLDQGVVRFQIAYAWPAPPLAAWFGSVDDAEMKTFADGRRDAATRWVETVLAGRLARLLRAGSARQRLEAMRAAEGGDAASRARTWLRQLTPVQRALIERFALVRAGRLAARLEDELDALGPDDEGLPARWRSLCHERDDLEGVRVLLQEAGTGGNVGGALRRADEIGRAIRFSWPPGLDADDERLRRVSEGDPGAWWGSTRRNIHLF